MPEVRLIDAIDLVRYLCGACPSHQNGECIDKMCWKYEDRARIENAPTIEAEPVRRGRWIETRHTPIGDTMYCDCNCSICNFEIIREKGQYPRFCENCGARMDGGADNGFD